MKFKALLSKFYMESEKQNSNWIFLQQMRAILPEAQANSGFLIQPSDVPSMSIFNMSSISQNQPAPQDPELAFLMQLLPDIRSLDQKTKSIFKLQVLTLVHNLKYNEFR